MNDERTSGAQCVEDESEDRGRCDCMQLHASMRPCARCRAPQPNWCVCDLPEAQDASEGEP